MEMLLHIFQDVPGAWPPLTTWAATALASSAIPSSPVRSVSAHQPVPSFSVNADLDPIIPLFRGPQGGSPCHPEGKPKLMRPSSVCSWPPPMPVHTVFSSVISPSVPHMPASLFLCPYPWHLEHCSQIAAWLTPSNVLGLRLPIPSTKKPFLTSVKLTPYPKHTHFVPLCFSLGNYSCDNCFQGEGLGLGNDDQGGA